MANAFRLTKDPSGKKPTRYYSSKQEKSIAKAVGGRQVANSGATAFDKADVKSENWLFEAKTKTTDSKTLTVHEDWFTKTNEETAFMGKRNYAVVINFGPDKPNYYCINEITFQEFLAFQEKYGPEGYL